MRTKIGIQVLLAHQLRKYYINIVKYREIEAIFENGFGFDEDLKERSVSCYTTFLVSSNYYLFLKYGLSYYILSTFVHFEIMAFIDLRLLIFKRMSVSFETLCNEAQYFTYSCFCYNCNQWVGFGICILSSSQSTTVMSRRLC